MKPPELPPIVKPLSVVEQQTIDSIPALWGRTELAYFRKAVMHVVRSRKVTSPFSTQLLRKLNSELIRLEEVEGDTWKT